MSELLIATKHVGLGAIIIAAALSACDAISGCSSAEARYQAALVLCVEQAKTLAESKACRRQVDLEFGVLDAGGSR